MKQPRNLESPNLPSDSGHTGEHSDQKKPLMAGCLSTLQSKTLNTTLKVTVLLQVTSPHSNLTSSHLRLIRISWSEPPHYSQEVAVAGSRRFTRIPKTTELINAGVPAEAIGTYCCLADYANNKTGLCWPKMESLAQTLNRSVRTVQRHLHLLR